MTDALKAELAERIAAKRMLVVVGTGVSLAATGNDKLASWKGLITSGIDRLVELGLRDATWAAGQKQLLEGDLDDLLGVAEQVSRRLGWKQTEPCGGDWNGWLRTTVGGLRAKHPDADRSYLRSWHADLYPQLRQPAYGCDRATSPDLARA